MHLHVEHLGVRISPDLVKKLGTNFSNVHFLPIINSHKIDSKKILSISRLCHDQGKTMLNYHKLLANLF